MAASSVGPDTSAMANPASLVKKWDAEKANWLKVGHGLLHLRDLLIPETIRVMKEFHASIIEDVVVKAACSCEAENLKKKTKHPPCGRCGKLLKKINAARSDPDTQLSWSNTDPTRWLEDWWEVAKCFLGSGQTDNHGPEDTDSANLLTLWINCAKFAPLSTSTVLLEVRHIRNIVAHDPEMTCSTKNLQNYFSKMLNVVKDPKLCVHIEPISIAELEEIQREEIEMVSREEANILKDFDKQKSVLQKTVTDHGVTMGAHAETIEHLQESQKEHADALGDLRKDVGSQGEKMENLQEKQQDQETTIGDVKQEMGDHGEKMQDLRDTVQYQEVTLKDLTLTMDELKFNTEVSYTASASVAPMELLGELQKELKVTYQRECGSVYPVPWFPESLELDDIFQEITLKDGRRKFGDQRSQERSFGLNEVFRPVGQNMQEPRSVLIEGAPGVGKTMLCQRLVLQLLTVESPSGANASTGQERHTQSTSLPNFGAILFLRVRDLCPGDLMGSLLNRLLEAKWGDRRDSLKRCLMDNCQQLFFLLDGFDEGDTKQRGYANKLLDGREMKGSFIMVTSRPGFRNLTPPPDMTYRLDGFDEVKQKAFIACFDRVTHTDSDSESASSQLTQFEGHGFLQFPLLLALICFLARQGQSVLPTTVTGLYQQFVEFMNHKAVEQSDFEQDYVSGLHILMQNIAFRLFSSNKSELTESELTNYVSKSKVKNTIEAFCKLGLMCQEIKAKGLTNYHSCSFIHQSFLDYFLAMYFVSLEKKAQSKFIEKVEIHHNVFLFVVGMLANGEEHIECFGDLLAAWKRDVEVNVKPLNRDVESDMMRLDDHTMDHHSLLHAPLWWVSELEDPACLSVEQVTTITDITKALSLTNPCTASCGRGVIALSKVCRCHHDSLPSETWLYLVIRGCSRIHLSVQFGILQQVLMSKNRMRCVELELRPLTSDEGQRLAHLLPRLTHLVELAIDFSAMDFVSRGFEAASRLQLLRVDCSELRNSHPSAPPCCTWLHETFERLACLEDLQEILFWDCYSLLPADISSLLNNKLPKVRVQIFTDAQSQVPVTFVCDTDTVDE